MDFQQWIKERIDKQKDTSEELVRKIQEASDISIKNYEVKLYGSHATGLCLPWSDVDVVLVERQKKEDIENINKESSDTAHSLKEKSYSNYEYLNELYGYLKKQSWVRDCKLIGGASVPIIKLITSETFNCVPVDISIQDERHFGLKCVDMVKSLIEKYECVKPLLLVLKNILKRANLNDPYKGGISSYGLVLMIVYFLQQQMKCNVDVSLNNNTIGKLFFEFIKFFGKQFDSTRNIIYIENGNNEFPPNFGYSPHIMSELIIIDPLNYSNNVSKSCFQYINIKMSFILCLATLQEDCACGCHYIGAGEDYNNTTADHCFLKKMFNAVTRFN